MSKFLDKPASDTLYRAIILLERTGASSATISRVNRCLHYGAEGYHTVIPRLKGEKEEES